MTYVVLFRLRLLHTLWIANVLGVLDLLYVKWRYIENLSWTNQGRSRTSTRNRGRSKVKGKNKQMPFQRPGAPHHPAHDISAAEVVITIRAHYWVALKYVRDRMIAR
jgi:flagellar biosynthetic protein FlhB